MSLKEEVMVVTLQSRRIRQETGASDHQLELTQYDGLGKRIDRVSIPGAIPTKTWTNSTPVGELMGLTDMDIAIAIANLLEWFPGYNFIPVFDPLHYPNRYKLLFLKT